MAATSHLLETIEPPPETSGVSDAHETVNSFGHILGVMHQAR